MRPANNRDKQIKIWLIIEKIYDLEYGIRVLNYKHLHYFQCVARAGSVVRAAERLHLTPQTLSGQLSQFEARLGITLFNRVGRRLELTKTGRLALSYAEEIFQAGSELEDLLKGGAEERFITFRVGISDVVPKFAAYRFLSPVLSLPEPVRLVCEEDRLDRLLAELAGQSHLHVITPSSSARNSSIVAASMRLDLMLALRVVLSRSRFITMWRTMARLLAA